MRREGEAIIFLEDQFRADFGPPISYDVQVGSRGRAAVMWLPASSSLSLSRCPRQSVRFPGCRPASSRAGPHFTRRPIMGKKLYVGNLAYSVTDSTLQQLFSAHGTVTSAQVIM